MKGKGNKPLGDDELHDLVDQLIKIIGTQSRVIEALGDALTALANSKEDADDADEDSPAEER